MMTRLLLIGLLAAGLSACVPGGVPPFVEDEPRTGPVYEESLETVSATVQTVDTARNTLRLERLEYGERLQNQDRFLTVYFDRQANVEYRGQLYYPSDLEVGDELIADLRDDRGRLYLQRAEVTRSVSEPQPEYADSGLMGGEIQTIDTRAQRITLQTSRGRLEDVFYDRNTPVYFQGRRFGPADLERGDQVRIELAQGRRELFAQQIDVVSNVPSATSRTMIDGDVRTIDLRAQRIVLATDDALRTGFNTQVQRVELLFDQNTEVIYQGRGYGPENLEPGDRVRVDASRSGNEWYAERIEVTLNVRDLR